MDTENQCGVIWSNIPQHTSWGANVSRRVQPVPDCRKTPKVNYVYICMHILLVWIDCTHVFIYSTKFPWFIDIWLYISNLSNFIKLKNWILIKFVVNHLMKHQCCKWKCIYVIYSTLVCGQVHFWANKITKLKPTITCNKLWYKLHWCSDRDDCIRIY